MNKMLTLLRREMWESPVAFRWTPIGIGILMLVVIILSLLFTREIDTQNAFTMDIVRWAANSDLEQRRNALSAAFLTVAGTFNVIMFVVVVFYLAHSLYDDRKDRTILFWKSLPVSETQTVLSKLLTACLLVPACYFLAIMATWLGLLLIATLYGIAAGVNPITALWLPALDPATWLLQISSWLVMALWVLPIYGWLIFCSAWAPRLPILMAIGIPLLLGLFQNFYTWITAFQFPGWSLWLVFFGRIGDGLSGMTIGNLQFESLDMLTADNLLSFSALGARLASLDLWLGVGVGIVFLVASIHLRKRATDN